MRRAVNGGSQPVRNLASNPRWASVGGSGTIRTNFATDPRMTSTAQGVYGGGTLSLVTGLSGAPEGITTAVRVTHSTSANSGALLMSVPDHSTQYTFYCWVYNEGAVVQNFGMAIRSVASNGDVGVQPGIWTKLTWKGYTTPASGMTAFNAFGVRIAAPSQAGTFLVTGVMVEKAGAELGPFFDGASGTTNDHTHSWAGSANNSVSYEGAVGMSLTTANTTGTGNKFTFMCSDRPAVHNKFIRFVIDTTNSVALNTLDCSVPAGVKRTNLFYLRTSRAMTIQVRYRSEGGVVSNGPIINTTANEWQVWRLSDKPTAAANQHLSLLIPNPNTAPGDMIDLGPHMVVEGEYTGDYIDGTKGFSKWDDVADTSTSVGYPPQLLDIAGVPEFDMSGTANVIVPLAGGFTGAEARTFYTVYQPLVLPGAGVHVMVTYGDADLNDSPNFSTLQLRIQGSTLMQLLNRRTGGQGALIASVPYPFNNVACWGINNDGFQFAQNNNQTLVTSSQVMDVLNEAIRLHAANANVVHVRTIMYRGFHDTTTRTAINRYLANKHGGYVT